MFTQGTRVFTIEGLESPLMEAGWEWEEGERTTLIRFSVMRCSQQCNICEAHMIDPTVDQRTLKLSKIKSNDFEISRFT